MTDHQKPQGDMTAAQLVALFADDARHPLALDHELRFCPMNSLIALAYGECAETPMIGVDPALAAAAYDEMERRQAATFALRSELGRIAGVL